MNIRNIMIALQAIFVSAGYLQALPAHGADQAIDLDAQHTMPQETVFSPVLRFQGDVVDVLPSGQAIRTSAIMRGKRFEWLGKIDNRVASEERELDSKKGHEIDDLSVEELAENLRGIALFNGHQFIEAEPAMALAIRAKKLRALELAGTSDEEIEKLLPGTSASQGTADRTEDLGKSEAGESAGKKDDGTKIVHGTDERRVMNNFSYPHRTHIVFDNTGSTSSINGSQGSGTLIGPSTAMSVAHVFWNEAGNTWEADHRWAPGYDSQDSDRSPWGEWYRCYWVTIPSGYVLYENTYYDFAVLDFDVGCNSVRNGVNSDHPGSTVGWLGNYTASTSAIESKYGYMRGYPASNQQCGNPTTSCGVRIWGDTSRPSENDALSSTIRHYADSSGGQSGSAFYHYADPTCSGCGYGAYLVGMHRAGYSSYNEARRYNSTVRSFMKSYSSDY